MKSLVLFKRPTALHQFTRKDVRGIYELSKAMAITNQRYRASNLKTCQAIHFKRRNAECSEHAEQAQHPPPHCLLTKHPTTQAVVKKPRHSLQAQALVWATVVLVWHTECEHSRVLEAPTELSKEHEESHNQWSSGVKQRPITRSTHWRKVQAERGPGHGDHHQSIHRSREATTLGSLHATTLLPGWQIWSVDQGKHSSWWIWALDS